MIQGDTLSTAKVKLDLESKSKVWPSFFCRNLCAIIKIIFVRSCEVTMQYFAKRGEKLSVYSFSLHQRCSKEQHQN